MLSLWLGAVPPFAAGLATGGLAIALGGFFAAACPLMVASSARWPVRASRFFSLYFVVLFVIAFFAFEFNSVAFVVDTWSALLLGLLTAPAGLLQKMDSAAVDGAPPARRAAALLWAPPRLVGVGRQTGE